MERKDKREVVDSIVWDYLISDNSEIHDRIEAMFIAHLISRLVEDDPKDISLGVRPSPSRDGQKLSIVLLVYVP